MATLELKTNIRKNIKKKEKQKIKSGISKTIFSYNFVENKNGLGISIFLLNLVNGLSIINIKNNRKFNGQILLHY